MTQDNTSPPAPNVKSDGSDLFNTAAGWVLFAAGLGLGLSILSGKYFHGDSPQRPEQLGYVIEGAEAEGGDGPAEMTVAEALTLVTAEDGAKVYAKCLSCHTIDAGGANGVGPNLHGIMGAGIAAKPGFSYSSALAALDGQWDWDRMDAWLKNPRGYVEGTKMGFAGLSKVEDRAAVALYMNQNGSNLPLPAFTPAEPDVADEALANGEASDADAGTAEAETASDATAPSEAATE